MLYLKKINLEDAEKEYALTQKIPKSENGYENPAAGATFEEFVSEIIPRWLDYDQGKNLPEGRVPDTCYFLWADDTPVGIFKLRHYLNDFLRDGPGHIGYGIAEEYRGRGYATEGLRLLLKEAKSLPIDTPEAYLSVWKSNPASLKAQLKNGAYIHHEDDKEYYTRIPL